LHRHRLAVALAGVTIVLGVAALDTHAALPEHHDAGEGICLCALAIATLGMLGAGFVRSICGLLLPLRRVPVMWASSRLVTDRRFRGIARAGPEQRVVLRR
jgi:hypothetical protein